MKVYEDPGLILPQAARKGPKKEAAATDFQKIMERTRSQAREKENVPGPLPPEPGLEGVRILPGVEKTAKPTAIGGREKVIGALQETLDLVDFYAGKLGDPSSPIRGLEPLVDHLEERMEGLKDMRAAAALPERLQSILSDLVLTLGTEIAKFKRGDYT